MFAAGYTIFSVISFAEGSSGKNRFGDTRTFGAVDSTKSYMRRTWWNPPISHPKPIRSLADCVILLRLKSRCWTTTTRCHLSQLFERHLVSTSWLLRCGWCPCEFWYVACSIPTCTYFLQLVVAQVKDLQGLSQNIPKYPKMLFHQTLIINLIHFGIGSTTSSTMLPVRICQATADGGYACHWRAC